MSFLESGYAEVDKTKLYYEFAGEGDPIVLIHGNGGDHRHWDDQFEARTQRTEVVNKVQLHEL